MRWRAMGRIARQGAEEELIDCIEEALDPPPTARHPRFRKDEDHLQIERDLLDGLRGEVAAVIGIEGLRDATDMPAGIALAPDRVPQRQGSSECGRDGETEAIRGDRAAVVIEDDRQPWSHRCAALVAHPEVERRVVCLPEIVGSGRFPAMEQVEGEPIGLRPRVCQGDEACVDALDARGDGAITRHWPVLPPGDPRDLAMDVRRRRWWSLQRGPFDQLLHLRRQPVGRAPVRARLACQPGQSLLAIARDPGAQGPQ